MVQAENDQTKNWQKKSDMPAEEEFFTGENLTTER